MSNIVEFPIPRMSDEDLEVHQSSLISDLLAEGEHHDIQVECLRSWARSLQLRLSSYQVRRLRFTIVGAIAGALVMAALDGSAAVKLDRLLTWMGWVS